MGNTIPPLADRVAELLGRQEKEWSAYGDTLAALGDAESRTVTIDGRTYVLQHNPARRRSAAADVKDGQVHRPCFLCPEARPAEQRALPYVDEVTHHEYQILVNPFPIVPGHLTIVAATHTPQDLAGRIGDMARLARALPGHLVFFNGAKSGASAPDHAHFQAVPSHLVPVTTWSGEAQLQVGVASTPPAETGADRLNIACWSAAASTGGTTLRWLAVRRSHHRPRQYYATGEEQILISPATLEFCGLVPLARHRDFCQLTAAQLRDILAQVAAPREPLLRVGIMEGRTIAFTVGSTRHVATYVADGRLSLDGGARMEEALVLDAPFTLHGVTIGKHFHWQQQEDQTFGGALRIIARDGTLHAINHIAVEDYLRSVIASEMSARNNEALLKTHAVISRSWVLRQVGKSRRRLGDEGATGDNRAAPRREASSPTVGQGWPTDGSAASSPSAAADLYVRWFDHDDHKLYDVCADDHCQRYQGITRAATPAVARAVAETRGEVLLDHAGEVCDARFSKCCGGVTETFETCWQDAPHDYLRAVVDAPVGEGEAAALALTLDTEAGARRWILDATAPSFCNTSDPAVLQQVLNDYDRPTRDFYRWQVRYEQADLSALFARRTGLDVGQIRHLVPLRRGPSGRIWLLRVEGTRRAVTIGKELFIRMALSPSHLYSSAFIVDEEPRPDGSLSFLLRGAGWGHGVGLCQIGAACMSQRGYSYRAILSHYFPHTTLGHVY